MKGLDSSSENIFYAVLSCWNKACFSITQSSTYKEKVLAVQLY